MGRILGALTAATALAVALGAAACSSNGGPARTPTAVRAQTATARIPSPSAIASMAVGPTSEATPAPQSAAQCPDPNVTPVATSTPDGRTPDPSATATPMRIAHPAVVPPVPSPKEGGTPTAAIPAFVSDPALEALIRARLGDDASHYAVVIEDLADGRGVSIDADRVFYAASLFKLEVMYEVYAERAAGILDFGEEYVASDYYSSFDLGPHLVQPCSRKSIGELLQAMMSVSDNVAAVMLQDRAGAGNINNGMASLGLTKTRLTADGTLPGTAGDFARLLTAIADGQAVSASASGEMLDLMTSETVNDRIPAKLPAGTRVAHKTGNWDDATHDAGIVYGTKGTYVMVLMSDLGFGSDATSVEADMAQIAFQYFEGE